MLSLLLICVPSLTALVFVPASIAPSYVVVALATVAKFGSAVAYTVIYLLVSTSVNCTAIAKTHSPTSNHFVPFQPLELFPTCVRNSVTGTCMLASRIGAVMAPIITNMGPGDKEAIPTMYTSGTCESSGTNLLCRQLLGPLVNLLCLFSGVDVGRDAAPRDQGEGAANDGAGS